MTDPEFARIGLSGTEAKQRGIAYLLLKVPMAAVLRARSLMETRGFPKCLIERDSSILGFSSLVSVQARSWPPSRSRCSATCPTPHCAKRSLPTP